ncbi:MAG: hypothetical protein K6T75_08565 [Acetobacteraceae bacterium]|nr:hypothetical protein [Acetobacteraceae bacterium]
MARAESLAQAFAGEKQPTVTGLRNLLEAAIEAQSFNVLVAFVKYQIGRDVLPLDTGRKLLDRLEEMRGLAKRRETPGGELQLARYLLAFLYRAFVYEHRLREQRGRERAEGDGDDR